MGNALKFVGIEDVLDKAKVLGVKEKPILVGGGQTELPLIYQSIVE